MSSAKNNAKAAKADTPKSGKPWLLIIAIAVFVAAAVAAGTWFFIQRSSAQKIEQAKAQSQAARIPAPAQYFALEPPFVVNLAGAMGGPRYLQLEVQLMTRDPEALKNVEQHAPAIRARLLMLFSQAQAETLADRAGKEKLQAAALRDVKALMTAETGKPGVEQLLFTSFVMQ